MTDCRGSTSVIVLTAVLTFVALAAYVVVASTGFSSHNTEYVGREMPDDGATHPRATPSSLPTRRCLDVDVSDGPTDATRTMTTVGISVVIPNSWTFLNNSRTSHDQIACRSTQYVLGTSSGRRINLFITEEPSTTIEDLLQTYDQQWHDSPRRQELTVGTNAAIEYDGCLIVPGGGSCADAKWIVVQTSAAPWTILVDHEGDVDDDPEYLAILNSLRFGSQI